MLKIGKVRLKTFNTGYNTPKNQSSKTTQIIIAVIMIIIMLVFYYFSNLKPRIQGLKIETESKNSEHLQLDNISIKASPKSHRGTILGWNLSLKGTILNVSNQEIMAVLGDIKLEFFNGNGEKIAKDNKIPLAFCTGEVIIKAGYSKSFDWPIIDQLFKGRDAQGLKKCIVSIEEGNQLPSQNK